MDSPDSGLIFILSIELTNHSYDLVFQQLNLPY